MKPILYSTGCPKCLVLKRKLDQAFVSYDVCEDVDKMLELGIMSVPVLDPGDGNLLQFNDAVKWANAAAECIATG